MKFYDELKVGIEAIEQQILIAEKNEHVSCTKRKEVFVRSV